MSITSRERIAMALNHEEPDRVPIDLGSSRSTGINAIAYSKLTQQLGMTGDTVVFDVKQLLAQPSDELLHRLGVDVVILPRLVPSLGIAIDSYKQGTLPRGGGDCLVAAGYQPTELADGSLVLYDGAGNLIAKRPANGIYYDDVYNPLAEVEDCAELDKLLSLPTISDSELEYLRARAKQIHETTEFAISGATSFSLFERGWKDWGFENYLTNMYAEPEMIEHYLDKLTDAYIVMMERYLGAVGDYLQVVQNNDDLGHQQAMMIDPEIYRSMIKPRHARINAAIKKKCPHIKISLHSCGSIYPIIGDLVEAGYDILNPLQKECANMDPWQIKKTFGKQLTVWGGACSTQTTMTHGTVDEIVNEAKEMIRCYAPGGGFVFSQIHNIQHDISPDKIIALFDTALSYGKPDCYR